MTAVLGDLERARGRARAAAFRSLHHAGLTHADIARMWGISRQLVSRGLNDG